jgi:hypothetical protein
VEFSCHGEGQRHRRIEMRTADTARDVGGQHHGERPSEDVDQPVVRAERNGLPARTRQADGVHGAGAEAEQYQHERAEELGEHGARYPGAEPGEG